MPSIGSLLEIDGSAGEGGGQILRTSLTLSTICGMGFHISNIRAARQNPGLSEQHLAAVAAASEICAARVEGAALHSTELTFQPQQVRSGRYRFHIRTAGSASLLIQTILLPLTLPTSASSFQVTGGTHVPWSPCYHYLDRQWLPYLQLAGFEAQFTLHKSGFYPQGGGLVSGSIRPSASVMPLKLVQRGALLGIEGISAVANLDLGIARRQKRQALGRLLKSLPTSPPPKVNIRLVELSSYSKGTMFLLKGIFEAGTCCFTSLGEIGKPAERVADQAVDDFLRFLQSDGVVDPHLADQLMLPMLLAEGASEIRTSEITSHQLTNAAVVQLFLPGSIKIDGEPGKSGTITINPVS